MSSHLPLIDFYPSIDFKSRFFLSEKGEFFASREHLPDHLLFAIGPERGWTQGEEKKFKEQGLIPLRVSTHTLRVEIATFCRPVSNGTFTALWPTQKTLERDSFI